MFSPSLEHSFLKFFDFLAFADGSSPFISFAEKINEDIRGDIDIYLGYHIIFSEQDLIYTTYSPLRFAHSAQLS